MAGFVAHMQRNILIPKAVSQRQLHTMDLFWCMSPKNLSSYRAGTGLAWQLLALGYPGFNPTRSENKFAEGR
jgi:hypothetical protein